MVERVRLFEHHSIGITSILFLLVRFTFVKIIEKTILEEELRFGSWIRSKFQFKVKVYALNVNNNFTITTNSSQKRKDCDSALGRYLALMIGVYLEVDLSRRK